MPHYWISLTGHICRINGQQLIKISEAWDGRGLLVSWMTEKMVRWRRCSLADTEVDDRRNQWQEQSIFNSWVSEFKKKKNNKKTAQWSTSLTAVSWHWRAISYCCRCIIACVAKALLTSVMTTAHIFCWTKIVLFSGPTVSSPLCSYWCHESLKLFELVTHTFTVKNASETWRIPYINTDKHKRRLNWDNILTMAEKSIPATLCYSVSIEEACRPFT